MLARIDRSGGRSRSHKAKLTKNSKLPLIRIVLTRRRRKHLSLRSQDRIHVTQRLAALYQPRHTVARHTAQCSSFQRTRILGNRLPHPDITPLCMPYAFMSSLVHAKYADHMVPKPRILSVANSSRETGTSTKTMCRPSNEGLKTLIHRLPDEILLEILSMTFDPWNWSPGYSLSLALVCKRWHSIVMSSSAFWSHISSERDVHVARETLRRNPGGALIFHLDDSPYADRTRAERAAVLDLALTQVHRWKTFFFEGAFREKLFTTIGWKASALEELFVDLGLAELEADQDITLGDGHPLRCVSLKEIGLDWSSSRLAGLHSLTLDSISQGPSLVRFHSILSSSPLLEILHINDINVGDSFQPNLPLIQLPFLSNINLRSIPKNLLSFLLFHIETSACTSLSLGLVFSPHSSHRALALALNAFLSSPRIGIEYQGGTETTLVETDPGPIVRRYPGGTRNPGASIALKGIRLEEVLLKLVDGLATSECDPTVRIRVRHNPPAFVAAKVVLTHFLETRLPLETFLLEKLSQEWLGTEEFIYQLGEAVRSDVVLDPPELWVIS